MSLVATVTWLTDTYDATDEAAQDRAEWPPHPVRLFLALRSVARTQGELAALRWLEKQDPPDVAAPRAHQLTTRRTFVPTNQMKRGGGHQTYPGRTSGGQPRVFPRIALAGPRLSFAWSAAPDEEILDILQELARRVPYFGRSTSPALLDVAASVPGELNEAVDVWTARETGGENPIALRVPYSGLTQLLDDAYAEDQPVWGTSRSVPYWPRPHDPGERKDEEGHPAQDGVATPWSDDIVVHTLPRGLGLSPTLAVTLTAAFRAAVLSRAAVPLESVHGHGALPRVAFLPLVDVGHEHARGHVMGIAAALPKSLPPSERRAVLTALLGHNGRGLPELCVPGIGKLETRRHVERRLWGLDPQRWTGGPAGARYWATALPIVLPRHPRTDSEVQPLLALACRHAGFPEPREVETASSPLIRGGGVLSARHTVRHPGDRVVRFLHARLRFGSAVRGPVVLGSMRFYGLGLCVPDDDGSAGPPRGSR